VQVGSYYGKMIIDHCFNVVVNGESSLDNEEYTVNQRVFDTIKTGLRIRRLNGLKSALLMIELIRSEQHAVDAPELAQYFDNFIQWSLVNLPEEMVLALVKYAIQDRRLNFKKYLNQTDGWKYITKKFGPTILAATDDEASSPVWRKMSKYHKVLVRSIDRVRDAVDSGDEVKPVVKGIAQTNSAFVPIQFKQAA
jgi:hypothetical protein